MACEHKFINDLYIEYAKEWEPDILIVGTFNPVWADNNSADWFYGRTENNCFWKVLPELFGEKNMLCCNKAQWVKFMDSFLELSNYYPILKDNGKITMLEAKLKAGEEFD